MISPEARAVLRELADELEKLPRPLALLDELFATVAISRATDLLRDMTAAELSDADVARLYRAIERLDTIGGEA